VHVVDTLPDIEVPGLDGSPDDATRLLLGTADRVLPRYGKALREAPVFVATTLGGMQNGTRFFRSLREGREQRSLLKDYLPHMQCRHLQRRYGLRHAPVVITNACSSGGNAIGLAFMAVRAGAPLAVAIGYDIISEFVFGGFHALRLTAPDVCRPFDVERTGLVLGEGAAVMILEHPAAAREHQREPLAQVAAYAGRAEAYHVTKPNPDGHGAEVVMKDCLTEAGISPGEVQCLNTHGTATLQNDLMEARAVSRLFAGHSTLKLTANKSAIGHTLGAAGLIEGVLSIKSLREQVVPPTVHTRQVIPELEIGELVREKPQALSLTNILSTSYGFGGTNAALLFRKAGGHE
jgi:3-oxoacyl-(acyl-carrier-protein) synthase